MADQGASIWEVWFNAFPSAGLELQTMGTNQMITGWGGAVRGAVVDDGIPDNGDDVVNAAVGVQRGYDSAGPGQNIPLFYGPYGYLGEFRNQAVHVTVPGTGALASIYQDVSALQPDTLYTLTVAAASRPVGEQQSYSDNQVTISLVNGTDYLGTVLAATVSDPDTSPLPQGTFQDFTVSFTTGALVSGDLTIVLANTTSSHDAQIYFDRVSLDATVVPEPTCLALVGVASLVLTRRRR